MTVEESTAIIAAENLGRADIQVTARDPEGETATQPFSVTVEAPAFILSGTVSDRRRNGPVLAGAVVRLDNGQQESTRTDRDGRYRFGNVSGTVTVTASAEPSHVAETVEVTMEADRTIDFALEHTGIPPYAGTIFITPDILGPADPTSLRDITYAGRGERLIYDRRPDRWITVNAYLFDVRYADVELEFQVNPEFGRDGARAEVDTYAGALGRLPAVLLSRARKVQINAGDELFGGNWHDRSFLIHADQGRRYIRDGYLEEVFIHEGGHVSLDGAHEDSGGWRAAQQADGVFISEYARDYPDREDVAESILPYLAVRYRPDRLSEGDRSAILTAIPNRLIYFDEQGLDMSPYQKAFLSMVPVFGSSLLRPRGIWRRFEGPRGRPLGSGCSSEQEWANRLNERAVHAERRDSHDATAPYERRALSHGCYARGADVRQVPSRDVWPTHLGLSARAADQYAVRTLRSALGCRWDDPYGTVGRPSGGTGAAGAERTTRR